MANDKIKIGDYQVLADEIIGHEDISEIGGGTVRGAIAEIGKKSIKVVNTKEDFDGLEDKSGTIIVKNEDYVLSANEISYGDGSVKNAIDSVKQSIPTVPTVDATLNKNSTNPISNKVVAEKFGGIETEVSTVKEHLQSVDVNEKGLELFGYIAPKLSDTVFDSIDENGVYHKKVGRKKLSEFDYEFIWTDSNKAYGSNSKINNFKNGSSIICGDYTTYASASELKNVSTNGISTSTDGYIQIRDNAYINSTVVAFKSSLANKYLYYELDTEVTKSIYSENALDGINSSLQTIEFLGWEVPSECPLQNYVDANGNFHQRVGRVDLGSLTYDYFTFGANTVFKCGKTIMPSDIKRPSAGSITAKIYVSKYDSTNSDFLYYNSADKKIAIHDDALGILIDDSAYTDATAFKNAMKNTYLYYELATENVIKSGNEVFGNAKSFYFNANTDVTVDSNRLNAIKSVINSLDMKNQTNAMGVIRYYDGLYNVTNIIKSSDDIIMAFEFSHKSSKIIYWNISTERVIFEK